MSTLAAWKRMRGIKDPACPSCKGTGSVQVAYVEGGTYARPCFHCHEDHGRCGTCGGRSLDCYGIHD